MVIEEAESVLDNVFDLYLSYPGFRHWFDRSCRRNVSRQWGRSEEHILMTSKQSVQGSTQSASRCHSESPRSKIPPQLNVRSTAVSCIFLFLGACSIPKMTNFSTTCSAENSSKTGVRPSMPWRRRSTGSAGTGPSKSWHCCTSSSTRSKSCRVRVCELAIERPAVRTSPRVQ